MSMERDPKVAAEAVYWLSAAVIRYTSQPRQLSLTGLATLAALGRKGAQRISELAGLQGVAQPSMTVLVGSLESAGLVARRPDPSDGRAVLVSLTAQGEAFLAERRRAGAERLSEIVGKLSAQEAAALAAAVPALVRLRELQDEAMEAAAGQPSQSGQANQSTTSKVSASKAK
ncbi:MAG TPA: MarR family transcriptional regulator [Actinospica sp.]|nr:MarR family transcriptional regulator [Actinospica sp.]